MKRDMIVLKAVLKADYERHIKKFQNQLEQNIDLLFIGDSLVAYFPVQQYFSNKAINQGIPGDTTIGVLKRLDEAIRHHPKTIVCHIGTNDFVLTDDDAFQVAKRIKQIYDALKPARVIIISPIPINDDLLKNAQFKRNNKDLAYLNEQLEYLIPKYDYLNVYNLFLKNNMLNSSYTYDGLHLNEKGYSIYYQALVDML
jgi:lysophospholipase L1-like esterase